MTPQYQFNLGQTDPLLGGRVYIRLYQDWFPNLTEEQLDEKVIYSAINFWFKDEDAGTGKVWNYFKEI